MIEVPVFVLPLLLLLGLCAGLWGYASARSRAFRDFVAALQRQEEALALLDEIERAKALEARLEAAERVVEAANAVAEEHFGVLDGTKHDGEDDEVGCRICCGVVSYREHAHDCPAVRLRTALAAYDSLKGERFRRVVESRTAVISLTKK